MGTLGIGATEADGAGGGSPRPGMGARLVRATTLVLVLGALAVGLGQARRRPRVFVLGIDGLHLPLLDRLVAEKALPNFARLYREGTSGGVTTAETGMPPLSPRVWATFATGKLPRAHGIHSFTHDDGAGAVRLVSARDRLEPALWEIVSESGKRVGVVNWVTTFPVDRVNGFMISDRYLPNTYERLAENLGVKSVERDAVGLVYPLALAERLERLGLRRPFLPILSPEGAEQADRTMWAITAAAQAAYPVDLVLLYTRAMDELSHVHWDTHEALPGEHPPGDWIVDFMHRWDDLLGEVLAQLGPDDHVVVLSDHGFERSHTVGALSGEHLTRRVAIGVFLLYGPRVRVGARVFAGALDVAPTILELAGVAPTADMAGKVVVQALREPTLLPRQAARPRLLPAPEVPDATPADPAIVERLRALGYVR